MATACLLAALLATQLPSASAADKARAQALLVEGSGLYEAGKIEAALVKFRAAHAVFPSPKILFNIGQANRDLGRPVDAIEAFEGFLDGAPDADPSLRSEARRHLSELQVQVGWVEVQGAPTGAEVMIDGVARGTTPLRKPLPVDPGTHEVVVTHAGGQQRSRVAPRVGQTARVTVQAAVAPSLAAASPVEPPSPALVESGPADAGRAPVWTRPWFLAGAGATLATAVVAVVAGVSAGARYDDLKRTCGQTPEGCSERQIKGVDARARTANVFLVLSGAAAVATGVGVYLYTSRDSSGATIALRF